MSEPTKNFVGPTTSATDELRRLLEERGVEWRGRSDENVRHTTWNNMNCWFDEFPDGWTSWGMVMHGTPAEAIEATLGAAKEPPTAVKVTLPSEWNACEPIPWVDVTMPNGDVTHLVPEATLGRGECLMVRTLDNEEVYQCSKCKAKMRFTNPLNARYINYCPNCGRKVAQE